MKHYFLGIAASIALSACSAPQEPQQPIQSQRAAESQSVEPSPQPVPTEVNSMSDYEKIEQAALSGDYQAQRNLAYTLTTSIPHDPILGCAWRIVIVESGSEQVDQSDTGNKASDCDQKLNADELTAAKAQAKKLQAQIAGK
ncbi:hypothetical protein [[Pseudomonas] boreopolis]|uniref:hypothetical protein n=1 Tax=Xanthomonas boreopolis TaxID=86183 RepID=UPI003D4F760B